MKQNIIFHLVFSNSATETSAPLSSRDFLADFTQKFWKSVKGHHVVSLVLVKVLGFHCKNCSTRCVVVGANLSLVGFTK